MLLTDAERLKFADYLEMDAESSEKVAIQFEKLGGPPMVMLAKQERTIAAASRLIAKRLRSVESMSIGAKGKA